MLTKELILEILNKFYLDNQEVDVVSSGSIKNIVIYGNEINVDLEVTNPTLKSKNIIRENLLSFLKSNIDQKIEIKINFIVGFFQKRKIKSTILKEKSVIFLILSQFHLQREVLVNQQLQQI
jgi:metal-sulfur cluster biosynthetic enzyme